MSEVQHDASHDFDFLFGEWHIHNRRLLERLKGCESWEDFEATGECWPTLGGIGNMDEFISPHWPGYVGMALRFFNPQTRQWSIYWADTGKLAGMLQPPVMGNFSNGIGTFMGADEWEGQPVLVRFIWSGITPTTARWEQAFSTDHGQTWETNWIMDFTRVENKNEATWGSPRAV